ncbi:Nucleoprotein TPR [Ceratocystis lukuohia]|uniref:Nucleoprotein TPR n=1 Tax=Ceratocystis lukuohia TaxID=2019550 RepID=A0ABR4MPV0_9PEZI
MAAAAVDTAYLAGHLGLPVTSVDALPSDEATVAFLKAVAVKAKEFDDLYSSKIRVDIELENAVIGSESRCQAFKATADNALKEVETLNQKLKEEETIRLSLQNELQALKSTYADAESEIRTLRDRVETLQESSRANMALFESHSSREKELSEELAQQHQKNVQLSKEVSLLQQTAQTAQSATSTAKYRAEMLQQQLDLAQKNSDWLETEVKTKSAEALKYRKEKGARIAELQRENDDARAEIESLNRTGKQLRDRLDAAQAKAEDTMLKMQRQQESFARTEESYKQELENQRRLVDMSDQLSRKHQDRLQEMELDKERIRDNYENETNTIRVELEKERQTVADFEAKIAELESQIDEMQARLDQPAANDPPMTPRANTLGRAMSPFATPGSMRRGAGITATQAVEELFKVKGQLKSEQRRNEHLTNELDNVVALLEAKAPQINELQEENEAVKAELERMSQLSTENFADRDNALRASRKAQAALSTAQAEAMILRTQLRDLSTQIQMLVFNIHALETGVDQLTNEEKDRFEQLSKGVLSEEALSDMSDTNQYVTERFVVFKDIKELQQKNSELLHLTRELVNKMESEEAIAEKNLAIEDHQAVEQLQKELEYMTDETRSLKATMESYKSERDMFRRLLQQRSTASELGSLLGEEDRLPLASIETNGGAGREIDQQVSKSAIQELQVTFDNFREEQTSVRETLNNQIRQLSSEKNSLQSEIVKVSSQLRFETERYEMLHSNYVAVQSEMAEVQKRNQSYAEVAARQDIRTQQVAEELVESRGLLESMRNEAANLKAEKKLWKDIQERLTKDNEGLMEEKSRLSNLLSSQQSLLNEKDLAEAENRRKSQTRMEALESELTTLKHALNKEIEENKQLQLRKEFDNREAQKRIDDLSKSLSQAREDHVSAKTARDQLQARVDELSINLRNAEDRAGRLAPRPTPRPGMAMEAAATNDEDTEQRILDLENEIGDLKRDLELAQAQVENSLAQVEQYKQISQNAEESLMELTSTVEILQQETDKSVANKEAHIKELLQRIEEISSELANSNTQLSSLRDSQGELTRRFEDEKIILQEEISRFKEQAERHSEEKKYHQQDLRAQADIAAKAQQDYEVELVKHAEAAKLVQSLRTECNQVKSEAASLRADAESAKVTLSQSQASWEERRTQMEREINELAARREDLNQQNKILHEQLDSVTNQISALQQSRSQTTPSDTTAAAGTAANHDVEALRELNSYLRREKEIAEVQFDLKVQETKRLQQQLEYAQSQVDDARLKLEQERQSQSESNKSSLSHQDLMAKLNELNLYRESSVTLRNELTTVRAQLTEKNVKIEDLESKLSPLESTIEDLRTQKTYLEDEIKQIQEDRDRWQKRTEGILTKYGRVDPAEMDQLKQKITELEAQCNAHKESSDPLHAKIAELEGEKARWYETREKIVAQAKERSRKLTSEKNDALSEKSQAEAQLVTVTAELASAKASLEMSQQQIGQLQSDIANYEKQLQQLQAQAATASEITPTPAPAPAPTTTDSEAMAVDSAGDSNAAQTILSLQSQINTLTEQLAEVTARKTTAESQLESLKQELQATSLERTDALQKLETATGAISDLTAQVEASAASSGSNTAPTEAPALVSGQTLSEEEKKVLEERVSAAQKEAADAKQRLEEIETKINETVKARSDKMREALNNKLKESKQKLQEDFEVRLNQERVIWEAEHKDSSAEGMSPVKVSQHIPSAQAPTSAAESDGAKIKTEGTHDFEAALQHINGLGDEEMRSFLSQNTTLRSIMSHNLRKQVTNESAKVKSEVEQNLKAEYDQKIAQAREQGQLMEAKKSTVRSNMQENKLRISQHRLDLVEAASKDTPQKPVVEVWAVVKDSRPPPVSRATATAASGSVPGTPASATAKANGTPASLQAQGKTPSFGNSAQAINKAANGQVLGQGSVATTPTPNAPKALQPHPSLPRPMMASGLNGPASAGLAVSHNPFAATMNTNNVKAVVNPFATLAAGSVPVSQQATVPSQAITTQALTQGQPAGAANPTTGPTQQQQQQHQQQQHQAQKQQAQQQQGFGAGTTGQTAPTASQLPTPAVSQIPRTSGLPVLRGGGNQRGRGSGMRGRGGGHQRGGLNAAAPDFQAGTKRPNDGSNIGGAKRVRGGGNAGH